jgi:hypothetical protein
MDGKQILDGITGRPFPVDPGPHKFAFIEPTRGRQETTESARVGDHARVVEVTFPDPNAKEAAAATPGAPAADHPIVVHKKHGIPVMTYVLGGAGIVAAGTATYFRFSGASDYNHYNHTCSPYCNPADIDPVRTKFLVSDIAIGVSAAAFVGAAVVYFLNNRGGDESAPAEASISPLVGGGALAQVRTRF